MATLVFSPNLAVSLVLSVAVVLATVAHVGLTFGRVS